MFVQCITSGLIRRMIERVILQNAWMVIAESRALADHLRRDGIKRIWTLPPEPESTEYDHRLNELLRHLITGAESNNVDALTPSRSKPDPPGQSPRRSSNQSPPMPEHA